MRRLWIAAAAIGVATAWAAAEAAGDGGPSPGVMQGGGGVVSSTGKVRYVALPAESTTIVETVRVRGGAVWNFRIVKGHYGIPYVTNRGDAGGLSRDGRLLVLSDAVGAGLRNVSRFVMLRTKSLRTAGQIVLKGDFSYDALSPDASTLYLIQHISARDYTRYRVRAYDLGANRLLQRVIVDRKEPKEVMRGYPITRVTSADGSWVYTLYAGGTVPFVHALDTAHRQAVCLDVRWKGSQNALWHVRMSLSRDGSTIFLRDKRHSVAVPVPGAA
jgi:hypothetical protein